MKVYIASDHAGYRLKEEMKDYLRARGHEVTDFGNNNYEPSDDYPDFVLPLAQRVALETESLGIIFGRTGNGEAIMANKVVGIRAAVCHNAELAIKARQDNNANILSLGSDFVSMPVAEQVIEAFLETPFSDKERHKRRVEKITSYEKGE